MANEMQEDKWERLAEAAKPLIEWPQRRADSFRMLSDAQQYAQYKSRVRAWLARDYWTPDEFACLLHGWPFNDHPVSAWMPPGTSETWRTIERCLGGSLRTKDSAKLFRATLIRRDDCLAWSAGRVQPHPFWTRALSEFYSSGSSAKTVPTATVNQTPHELRLDVLREFLRDMEQKAAEAGHAWRRNAIPVTKADFHATFYQLHGDRVNHVQPDQLAEDVHELRGRFAPGTRSHENNELALLMLS